MILKWLAIVILLASILPVHGQEQSAHSGGNQDGAQSTPSPPPTPPRHASCIVKQDGTTIECQWSEGEFQSKFQRLFSPENAPNIGLVLVGLGGVVAAVLTLRVINRQVGHMRASERAWLTVDVHLSNEPQPESKLIWIEVPITNRGKTPARMHSIMATSKFIPVPDSIADNKPGKLPPDPDYSDSERLTELRGYNVIVAPGDTFMHHVYIWPKEYEKVVARISTLYVYATVDYFDTVGGDRHTTSFCSIYAVPLPNFNEPTGFTFSPYIPASYFRAT